MVIASQSAHRSAMTFSYPQPSNNAEFFRIMFTFRPLSGENLTFFESCVIIPPVFLTQCKERK